MHFECNFSPFRVQTLTLSYTWSVFAPCPFSEFLLGICCHVCSIGQKGKKWHKQKGKVRNNNSKKETETRVETDLRVEQFG